MGVEDVHTFCNLQKVADARQRPSPLQLRNPACNSMHPILPTPVFRYDDNLRDKDLLQQIVRNRNRFDTGLLSRRKEAAKTC